MLMGSTVHLACSLLSTGKLECCTLDVLQSTLEVLTAKICVHFAFSVCITASVPLPDERNDTLELENQRRLLKTLETITNRLNRTLHKEPMYSFQFASELIIADSNSLETEKAFLFCRPGSVLRGRMCGKADVLPLTCV